MNHREMRNQSGQILREVAAGEMIQVVNRGQIAALIVPPAGNGMSELVARGQVREARRPTSSLSSLKRRASVVSSESIRADARGRW